MPLYPYLQHSPQVDGTAFVAPTASVVGDVVIGAGASIWYGATLRGDVMPIRIGARTSIQDGSVLHATGGIAPCVVGEGCTVGHNVILHGCKIGNGVLVGMGAIVLDGAEVGDGAMIGAGALVTARTKIPPGVLVLGSPAVVKRPLSEAEKESLRESAELYLRYGREHKESLRSTA